MRTILFEKNTEPEVREVLRNLDFNFEKVFEGYLFNNAKRRTRYVCIVKTISNKVDAIIANQQTLF